MDLTTAQKKSALYTYGLLALGLSLGLDYFRFNHAVQVYSFLSLVSLFASIAAACILTIGVMVVDSQIRNPEHLIMLLVAIGFLVFPHVFRYTTILNTHDGGYYFIGVLLAFVDYAAFASLILGKAQLEGSSAS